MLYTEEELLEMISREGLTALKYDKCSDIGSVNLAINNLDVLIDYAKANQINYVFYHYHYLDEDDYNLDICISEAYTLQEDEYLFKDIFDLAKRDIAKYRRAVNSIDFGKPSELKLMCLHNGVLINISIVDSWVEDLILPAEVFLRELELDYQDELVKLKDVRWKEKQAQIEAVRNELKDLILSNSEFATRKNQNSRYVFINSILDNPENSKFRDAFKFENGNLDTRGIKDFIDNLYSEYKRMEDKQTKK